MKKHYEMLEMSVVLFDNEDIVTTSSSIVDDILAGENEYPFSDLNK